MGRDISKLHPELQEKISRLRKECEKAGLKIGIGECVRTVKEQDERYSQGRSKPGKIVTNARGSSYSSMHQWGVAFDIYRNDGKGVYNTSGKFFEKVGEIGVKIGLEWGGNWRSFPDRPHFQLPYWGSTAANLKAKYGTPDKFMATWGTTKKSTNVPNKVWSAYKVTASALRLRNKPSLASSVIEKMPKGSTFYYMGEATKNGFMKGMYGKKVGWASSKYLTKG